MKKLVYLLLPMFLFFACNNAEKAKTEENQDQQEVKGEKKSCCSEFADWDSYDVEKKAELVNAFVEKMNAKAAEMEEGEELEALKAKLADIAAAEDVDAKKAIIDELIEACKAKCCKHGEETKE